MLEFQYLNLRTCYTFSSDGNLKELLCREISDQFATNKNIALLCIYKIFKEIWSVDCMQINQFIYQWIVHLLMQESIKKIFRN